jgi:hypothetical protein
MRKKLKENKLQVWVDSHEMNSLRTYAESNHLTVSELIRGWIHEVMKREGYYLKEPLLPKILRRRSN